MVTDWIKLKTEFFLNRALQPKDLAIKHKLNVHYVQNKAAEEKWREEREEIWKVSGKKIIEKLPDTIANVKLRHIKIARLMQSKALQLVKSGAIESKSTYSDLKSAIDIERDALGLNDKKMQDEQFQKLQQFNFILTLNEDELRRFIKSLESRVNTTDAGGGEIPADANPQNESGAIVEGTEVSR